MDKKKVKNYFSKNNTVSEWWNPHKSDKEKVYKRQEIIVKEIMDLNNTKKIIDISCGKGRFAKILSKNKKYVCLDISKEMLNFVKKLNLNVKLIKGDAENIPLKEKFDRVICAESLVHYPNPKKALLEMKRILENDGKIILTVDNKYCFGKIIRIIEDFFSKIFQRKTKGIGNEIYQPYSAKEYKKMFKRVGLKISKTIKISILTTPVKLYSKNKYLITPKKCKRLEKLDKFLEKLPLIRRLSTYFIYILEK